MFERNADNYSIRDQLRLWRSCVAVCGLGGGGGQVAELLARTGVGRLILIDADRFEDSNRNRQIGALGSTLGALKVEVTARRLQDANPYLRVTAHAARIGPDNAALLRGADLICDCVDGDNKRILNEICQTLGQPYCTGGLSGEVFQAALFDDPRKSAGLYPAVGSNRARSLQADPAALAVCSGFQARLILNFLLSRDNGTLNRIIRGNLLTCALSVEDLCVPS